MPSKNFRHQHSVKISNNLYIIFMSVGNTQNFFIQYIRLNLSLDLIHISLS